MGQHALQSDLIAMSSGVRSFILHPEFFPLTSFFSVCSNLSKDN